MTNGVVSSAMTIELSSVCETNENSFLSYFWINRKQMNRMAVYKFYSQSQYPTHTKIFYFTAETSDRTFALKDGSNNQQVTYLHLFGDTYDFFRSFFGLINSIWNHLLLFFQKKTVVSKFIYFINVAVNTRSKIQTNCFW